MNSAVHDREMTGKFLLRRGHFSCIWKVEKAFSKHRRLLIFRTEGTEGILRETI